MTGLKLTENNTGMQKVQYHVIESYGHHSHWAWQVKMTDLNHVTSMLNNVLN